MDDLQLRAAIYRHFADRAQPPGLADMSRAMRTGPAEIKAAYQRLYAKRMLVPMPDGESIRMAPPFAGVATQHEVRVNGKRYYANCAWDSFGIPAALHAHGEVTSRCEQSKTPLSLTVGGGEPLPEGWLFHTPVRAAHWWRDIVYT